MFGIPLLTLTLLSMFNFSGSPDARVLTYMVSSFSDHVDIVSADQVNRENWDWFIHHDNWFSTDDRLTDDVFENTRSSRMKMAIENDVLTVDGEINFNGSEAEMPEDRLNLSFQSLAQYLGNHDDVKIELVGGISDNTEKRFDFLSNCLVENGAARTQIIRLYDANIAENTILIRQHEETAAEAESIRESETAVVPEETGAGSTESIEKGETAVESGNAAIPEGETAEESGNAAVPKETAAEGPTTNGTASNTAEETSASSEEGPGNLVTI